MGFLSGSASLSYTDLYTSFTETIGYQTYGQYQEGPGGRWYRLAKAGASNLVVGNLLQSPAYGTDKNDLAVPTAVAAGTTASTGIVVTNGTNAVVANDFVGGSAEVSVTPALGEEYTITGNSAAANGAALTLYFDRPIRTAWTTSTKVTLTASDFNGVIQSPATTLTGVNTGFAVYAIPTVTYGWIQTHGDTVALSDSSSILMGSGVAGGSGTAGAVTVHVSGFQVIGTAKRAAASGKTIPLFATID